MSGPGMALQAHNQLWELVNDAQQQMWDFKLPVSDEAFNALPPTFRQRCLLMTAMSGAQLVATCDGVSVAPIRDRPHRVRTKENVLKTVKQFEMEHELLEQAETHFINDRIMQTLVDAAANAEPEPLFDTDLPSPTGLMVFETPLLMDDLHPDTGKIVPGLTMPVRAIGWTVQKVHTLENGELVKRPGIVYFLYTTPTDYITFYVAAVKELLPEMANDYGHAATAWGAPWFLSDFSAWTFGVPWTDAGDTYMDYSADYGSPRIISNVAYVRRFMFAYFRWTWQRILVHRTHKLNRAERRQSERAGRDVESEQFKLQVVLLRREYEFEQKHGRSPTAEEFQHEIQWLVGGHPRRQYYPSLGPVSIDGEWNQASHRLIWIEPYTKGNPLGPLVVNSKVIASVR